MLRCSSSLFWKIMHFLDTYKTKAQLPIHGINYCDLDSLDKVTQCVARKKVYLHKSHKLESPDCRIAPIVTSRWPSFQWLWHNINNVSPFLSPIRRNLRSRKLF